jgi:DNA-directed RNA polymerase specialized sigma subunit
MKANGSTKMNGRATKGDDDATDPAVAELRDIKRLLVLLLMKAGASQREIATVLNVNQATVSRQFHLGDVDPITTRSV